MVSRSPPSTCPSDASCGVEPSAAAGVKLTKAERRLLARWPDDWLNMPDEWRASATTLDLIDRDLLEWREAVTGAGDVRTGPGSHGHYFWQVRRTSAGRLALGLADTDTSARPPHLRED